MPMIHPLADVEKGAQIGEGTRIWRWTHVCATAYIGRDCSVGQGCYIGPAVVIGDRVRIQNNVSVFTGVRLHDDVFVGPGATFTNVMLPVPGVKQPPQPTLAHERAMIGANATIVCGLVIGEGAVIGAGAVVVRDVPPGATVVGNPARRIK